jgi:hypothetical protein
MGALRPSILDTSVIIAGEPYRDGLVAVSVATLAELHFGVMLTKSADQRAERLRRLAYIENSFPVMPVDARVAHSYGVLASLVQGTGRSARSRVMDLLIAATAHAHGARLVTRNPEDLRGLGDVLEIVAA